jgi:hypothetical protein
MMVSIIQLAISSMDKYVSSRRISIPGDDAEDIPEAGNVEDKLENILAHIEDLVEIKHLVRKTETTAFYNDPHEDSDVRYILVCISLN